MIGKLIRMGVIVLAAAVLVACSRDNQPPETRENTPARQPRAEATVTATATTAAAMPTRKPEAVPGKVQRLDHLLPSPTAGANPATPESRPAATAVPEAKRETGNPAEATPMPEP